MIYMWFCIACVGFIAVFDCLLVLLTKLSGFALLLGVFDVIFMFLYCDWFELFR